MLRLFLQFELGKVKKYFKTNTTAKVITAVLFLVVFVFLGMGIYGFFASGFRYIYFGIEEEFKIPLFLFIYETFLLILAGVIVVSSMVSGVFNLFRGQNDAWFIGTPGYKIFPKLIFVKSLFVSIWPLIIIFLPVVLAFNKMYQLGFGSFLLIIFSVILLLVLTNAITLSLIVFIGYLYFLVSKIITPVAFHFKGFVAILLVTVIVNLVYVWKVVSQLDLVRIFKADNADAIITTANIGSYFEAFPTHSLAMEILSLQRGNFNEALTHAGNLTLIALVAIIAWWLVSYLFYPLWQVFQEGNNKETEKKNTRSGKVYQFQGSQLTALFKKESLIASRNWKNVLWFSFLACIWLVQIGVSVIMEHNIRRHETDISATLAILQTIQFVIAAYFICAFTLRFVFPSFSIEKKTSWILGTAPVSMTRLFFGKYFFYTSFFVLLGLVMNYINVNVLNVSITQALYSTTLLVVTIVFVVTFGMILGALFPNKESDDPGVISTSMSGLFFTASSLLYGGLGAWTLYQALTKGELVFIEAFVLFSLLLVAVMLSRVSYVMRRSIFD
ncbi:MAG: type transport system permease protein [Patescibacteria group bacterium]|nr:type transport system permease protein [Patescibacteria group bacterium]